MARVYRGLQLGIERNVAIKVLHPNLAENETFIKRFLREARVISNFNHPNIVRLIDFGQEPDHQVLYLVMELIEGLHLDDLVSTGRLRPELATEIVMQICSALSEAHAADVVHRDLKPSNIMLIPMADGQFQVKIIDFGIADALQHSAQLTQTGAICGTPRYMAPEQVLTEEVDARADIYSIGALLFEMLSGRPVFRADRDVAMALRHARDSAPSLADCVSPADVPESLVELTDDMLLKDREARPQSILQVRNRLMELRREASFSPIYLESDEPLESQFSRWIREPEPTPTSPDSSSFTEERDTGHPEGIPDTDDRGIEPEAVLATQREGDDTPIEAVISTPDYGAHQERARDGPARGGAPADSDDEASTDHERRDSHRGASVGESLDEASDTTTELTTSPAFDWGDVQRDETPDDLASSSDPDAEPTGELSRGSSPPSTEGQRDDLPSTADESSLEDTFPESDVTDPRSSPESDSESADWKREFEERLDAEPFFDEGGETSDDTSSDLPDDLDDTIEASKLQAMEAMEAMADDESDAENDEADPPTDPSTDGGQVSPSPEVPTEDLEGTPSLEVPTEDLEGSPPTEAPTAEVDGSSLSEVPPTEEMDDSPSSDEVPTEEMDDSPSSDEVPTEEMDDSSPSPVTREARLTDADELDTDGHDLDGEMETEVWDDPSEVSHSNDGLPNIETAPKGGPPHHTENDGIDATSNDEHPVGEDPADPSPEELGDSSSASLPSPNTSSLSSGSEKPPTPDEAQEVEDDASSRPSPPPEERASVQSDLDRPDMPDSPSDEGHPLPPSPHPDDNRDRTTSSRNALAQPLSEDESSDAEPRDDETDEGPSAWIVAFAIVSCLGLGMALTVYFFL